MCVAINRVPYSRANPSRCVSSRGDGAAHPPRGRPAQPGPGQARQGGGPHGQAGLRQEGDTGGSSASVLYLLP